MYKPDAEVYQDILYNKVVIYKKNEYLVWCFRWRLVIKRITKSRQIVSLEIKNEYLRANRTLHKYIKAWSKS